LSSSNNVNNVHHTRSANGKEEKSETATADERQELAKEDRNNAKKTNSFWEQSD